MMHALEKHGAIWSFAQFVISGPFFSTESLPLLPRHTTLDWFLVPIPMDTIPGVCYPVKLDCLTCTGDAEYSPLPGTTKGGETKHHQHSV